MGMAAPAALGAVCSAALTMGRGLLEFLISHVDDPKRPVPPSRIVDGDQDLVVFPQIFSFLARPSTQVFRPFGL